MPDYEIFERPEILALPIITPVHGVSSNCMFMIKAVEREYITKVMAPRNRSSLMAGFAVWRAMDAGLLSEDQQIEDGEYQFDEELEAAIQSSADELREVRKFIVSAELELRALWPYEAWLSDQVMEGNPRRAMFACYQMLGDFPNMVPHNENGAARSITSIPSMVGRIQIDPMSPNLIPVQILYTTQIGPTNCPCLTLIPGGAGNTLFDHDYVNFGVSARPQEAGRANPQ